MLITLKEPKVIDNVMGVMKIGNIVHRAEIELTSLEFWVSVLPSHHVGFPDVTIIPTPSCLCSSVPQRSLQITTLVAVKVF